MTPKRYEQTSMVIRWAYLFEEVKPLRTSTCALFWRSVLISPLKILGPALLVACAAVFMGYAIFATVADTWWAEWFHESGWAVSHAHKDENDWRPFVWFLAMVGSVVAVVWLGNVSGLWDFLHGLCKPVEIEGGLVRKGCCPTESCPGISLVLEDTGTWRCRRCQGRFVPANLTYYQEFTPTDV